MKIQGEKANLLGATIIAGLKYDSHLVQTLESVDATNANDREDTSAGYAGFSAFWQHNFNQTFGFRTDYNIYADSYSEHKDNNTVDQLVSVEPQLSLGNFILSLPLQYTYAREDTSPDYYRPSVVPTVTWNFPKAKKAVEAYGMFSHIIDVDEYTSFDEDADIWGGGLAYLIMINTKGANNKEDTENRSYIRFQGDYSHTDFESRVWDYLGETSPNKRVDMAASLGVELNLQIKRHIDCVLRYTFIHTHSNVRLYDYDKHLLQLGWALRF